jgi:hypothetical protein
MSRNIKCNLFCRGIDEGFKRFADFMKLIPLESNTNLLFISINIIAIISPIKSLLFQLLYEAWKEFR